ncbi:MAG: DUF2845 domain-containing protein [Syntrophobacteraceae bacterium]
MKIVLFILISMFSVVYQAFGDDSLTDLRCNSGLIMIGESKLEIVSKCGEPGSKETIERRVPGSVRPSYVTIEEWTYNFGPRDFIHVLEFQGATLKAIRRGTRGF